MKVALVGAELEENLGLRYMASALEQGGHHVEIIPFNGKHEINGAVEQIQDLAPEITGLSMVFTSRAREFCSLAQSLRDAGYGGHIIAGGHFAALNCERLLQDFPAFDSVGLCEGEEIICDLAAHRGEPSQVAGLCFRTHNGAVQINPSKGNPENLDALPFPRRTVFHSYFDKPIASILSSRGCWRNCAFCSINAWYKQGGGKRFRIRSVDNIVAEMRQLYFDHGVRIFNFQDDNFFLPRSEKALQRFEALRDSLQREGIDGIAIAIKARPDSITRETIQVLDELGLFRVFLGVENASENELRHLNRKCTFRQILDALEILNDCDVHVAYNLLMFEPDTVMDDILTNLRFIERHMENPFNFCRAEAYAGTGLETQLRAETRLLGDYFGFDYRLKDPHSEAFHQIANFAFFDRNFSDFGLHYFNMQVDFYFHLLRRFHPEVLTERLRGAVRSFIKRTNLDTYECLCEIYDFAAAADPQDQVKVRAFARHMREQVDTRSESLYVQGKQILRWLTDSYENRLEPMRDSVFPHTRTGLSFLGCRPIPYAGVNSLQHLEFVSTEAEAIDPADSFGPVPAPLPYTEFARQQGRLN